jgi:hypothetical protein
MSIQNNTSSSSKKRHPTPNSLFWLLSLLTHGSPVIPRGQKFKFKDSATIAKWPRITPASRQIRLFALAYFATFIWFGYKYQN